MSELFPPPSPFPIRKKFIIFDRSRKMLEVLWFHARLELLNPSAPVGVADLKGRWSFDDDNFSVTASPLEFSGLNLWLDASELSSAGSTWADKSGNGNSATKTGSPMVIENEQNGLSVMRYTGATGQYHDCGVEISDILNCFLGY